MPRRKTRSLIEPPPRSRKVGWFDQRVQGGIVEVLAAPDVFTFHAPTKVLHGRGAIARLGDEVATECRRPLLVTDPGIVASGLHRRAIDSLERRGLAVGGFRPAVPHAARPPPGQGVPAGGAPGAGHVGAPRLEGRAAGPPP